MKDFDRGNKSITNKHELAKKIYEVSHLTGSFTLRSGKIANEYFDKYQFCCDPVLLDSIVRQLVKRIPNDTEVLAGLELGGIPIVVLLSHYSGLPAAFVRKEAKKYGTARVSEGTQVNGRKVLIVEDVVTSGGQIVISARQLRELGAQIDSALCVIDRQEGAVDSLASIGITLFPLLKRDDLS
ncbi:orotate phosphoribosyltransferase [Scytonema sp. UIC 10036]|uniref:orotate phosphoribosyltransferase n=1 Tax=Scytonema sp. UIC 10036 TaxID=2304196 RepID=UPI0012DA5DF1|nr:orotate phosphoribosyltransferase [Scytonema sp. UIC 10036]MUG95868.1 orotate phosphoribosyltransferase [Scytonema sp. UIC 10036]